VDGGRGGGDRPKKKKGLRHPRGGGAGGSVLEDGSVRVTFSPGEQVADNVCLKPEMTCFNAVFDAWLNAPELLGLGGDGEWTSECLPEPKDAVAILETYGVVDPAEKKGSFCGSHIGGLAADGSQGACLYSCGKVSVLIVRPTEVSEQVPAMAQYSRAPCAGLFVDGDDGKAAILLGVSAVKKKEEDKKKPTMGCVTLLVCTSDGGDVVVCMPESQATVVAGIVQMLQEYVLGLRPTDGGCEKMQLVVLDPRVDDVVDEKTEVARVLFASAWKRIVEYRLQVSKDRQAARSAKRVDGCGDEGENVGEDGAGVGAPFEKPAKPSRSRKKRKEDRVDREDREDLEDREDREDMHRRMRKKGRPAEEEVEEFDGGDESSGVSVSDLKRKYLQLENAVRCLAVLVGEGEPKSYDDIIRFLTVCGGSMATVMSWTKATKLGQVVENVTQIIDKSMKIFEDSRGLQKQLQVQGRQLKEALKIGMVSAFRRGRESGLAAKGPELEVIDHPSGREKHFAAKGSEDGVKARKPKNTESGAGMGSGIGAGMGAKFTTKMNTGMGGAAGTTGTGTGTGMGGGVAGNGTGTGAKISNATTQPRPAAKGKPAGSLSPSGPSGGLAGPQGGRSSLSGPSGPPAPKKQGGVRDRNPDVMGIGTATTDASRVPGGAHGVKKVGHVFAPAAAPIFSTSKVQSSRASQMRDATT
jgi:hypothetical protein